MMLTAFNHRYMNICVCVCVFLPISYTLSHYLDYFAQLVS